MCMIKPYILSGIAGNKIFLFSMVIKQQLEKKPAFLLVSLFYNRNYTRD
jgi:hypothetical protein